MHAATAKHLAGFWRERESKMAGKINYFVTYSGFNELFSGYNQGLNGILDARWAVVS